VDGQDVVLQIWDTAGQERFSALAQVYQRGANICFLVFDMTNMQSFEALERWKDEFVANLPNIEEDFPFACIASKSDLHQHRQVSLKRATNWCNSKGHLGMSYYETSSKNSTNVHQAFVEMSRKALKSIAAQPKTYQPATTVDLSQGRDSKSCCGT